VKLVPGHLVRVLRGAIGGPVWASPDHDVIDVVGYLKAGAVGLVLERRYKFVHVLWSDPVMPAWILEEEVVVLA
jgi:hypothetical protein